LPRQPKSAQVPSEAAVLEFLAASPGTVGKRDLARAFGLSGSAKIGLKKLLKDMEQRGVLNRKRKSISRKNKIPPTAAIQVVGLDKNGELFGEPLDWSDETKPAILIRASHSQRDVVRPPKTGDQVLARIEALAGDETYAYVARPIKSLVNSTKKILGVFRKIKGEGRIVSIDKKARHDLLVRPNDEAGALEGELVSAEIIKDRGRGLPLARIKQRHGDVSDQRNISLLAIHNHGIPTNFSAAVDSETEELKPFNRANRTDFRQIPLVTIDPSDARDHDDAVWATADTDPENDGGHIIIVAIADVAAYVRPGTTLDREARIRGNSTYFPDRVVPMLPERISNDLCSLREGEERPALAVTLIFDKHGEKRKHKFERVIMRSAAKLAYEEAQSIIDSKKPHPLRGILDSLWSAYRCVLVAREKRSPLELDLPERKIKLDATGKIASVIVPLRLEAHKLIEEFMIQANVAAAEELEARKSPLLYRVHDEPAKEKIRALVEFLRTIGQDFALGQVLHTRHFNRLLKSVSGEEFERVVHEVVLRSQAQAIYASKNNGHFGLSLRRYAHFTSPIRRYADLIVHRALVSALGLGPDGLSETDIAALDDTAEMISTAERRSMLAERETIDRLVAAHLAHQTGATFSGRISGAVSVGLFVRLDDTGADGFVPASALGNDYFMYEEKRHALIGRKSGEIFQLGDPVQVRLVEATPIKGGLRFEMMSTGKRSSRKSNSNPNQRSKKKR
jgi:ribonuclease R